MSSDQLKVDLDGLEAFSKQLDSIRSRMDATRNTIDSFNGQMGAAEVEDALHSFNDNWRDGRSRIDKKCEHFSKAADQTSQQLRQADQKLADDLKKSETKQPA